MGSSSEDPSAWDLRKFSAKEIGILKHPRPSCHEIEDGSRNFDLVYSENLCRKLADSYEGVNSLSEDDLIKLEEGKNSSSLPLVKLKLGTSADSQTIASGTSSASVSVFPLSSNMPKRSKSSNQSTQITRCQVQGCNLDLASAKDYHRRHRICETHSKSPKVIVAGLERRFCQQCSRFHSLSEFDDMKRSCRRRLSDHNARRRRPHPETIHFSPSGLSSSTYEGRLQNFLLNKTPPSASNGTWETFCSFKMGQVGNSLINPLAHTDRKLHLPGKHLNTGKTTSVASSDLDEVPVFPRALSLLSISSCGLSGMEPCSLEQNMQGHIGIARPVMELESQNWPIISSQHLQKEQVASTSSMNAMDFNSTDDSCQFQDFLSFKTSYEPNFFHSS